MDRPLNVLLVADVSPLQRSGGSARVVREQAIGLSQLGHSVTVFCRQPEIGSDGGGPLPDGRTTVLHYPVRRESQLSYGLSSILSARKSYRNRLRQTAWGAVVLHQPFSALGVASQLPASIPKLYCFHSPAGTEYALRAFRPETGRTHFVAPAVSSLIRRLEGRALGYCSRVIVLSRYSERLLADTHPHGRWSVTRIAGGVDLERFQTPTDRTALRRRLNLPEDALVLLTVRDLEPRMGIDSLIAALALLPKEPSFLCLIGGTGPLRRFLEDRVRDQSLDDHVRFLGHIPERDLSAYYQAADLFVLPTQSHEGFGLVTVEALACGTPVVATPAGATPEILQPLDSRLLSEDIGHHAIAHAITSSLPLAGDPEFRTQCRLYAECHYSWRSHAAALETELMSLQSPRRTNGWTASTSETTEPPHPH